MSSTTGGWINEPAANLDNINAQDLTNVRIKGLWQPSTQLSVSAMAIINRDERGMDFSDANSPETFTQVFGLATAPKVKNNYDIYNLTVAYDFPGARLSNSTGYVHEEAPQWGVPAFFQTVPDNAPGTIYDYYVALQDIRDTLLTDEMRLSSTGSGPWNWTLGGFYRRYTDAVDAPVNYYGLPGPASDPLPPLVCIFHRGRIPARGPSSAIRATGSGTGSRSGRAFGRSKKRSTSTTSKR